MNTAVPRFNRHGYQHQQVFDAIAKSNGWDDETAALQLFAHLEGEALNIALLTLEDQWVTRSRLSGALSDYYSSPGRLAIYRKRFESAVRRDKEDPSRFATELETLAARGFGDAGPNARTRMVRDRFVAGHQDCELRRHLDSVPLDTPIRDIVDRCRVWESHSDTHVGYQRLPTVTDNYRGLSIITGGPPVVAETPSIEPIVPTAIVRTAPPSEPTILEASAQKILDQTVNCGEGSPTMNYGEGSPTSVGSLLANFLGTPMVF